MNRILQHQVLGLRNRFAIAFIIVVTFLILVPASGLSKAKPATITVTTVVTVLGPQYTEAPMIDKREVNVTMGKSRLNVTRWEPARSSSRGQLQLAILIDNDVRSSILGQQLDDLANFINSLGKNTKVGLFYGEHGSATVGSPFSAHHKTVSQALRLSVGRTGGDSPSIYLSLADLVSHWQSAPAERREVLVLSSGNDVLNPGEQDPYFDLTLEKVQRAGVVVHSIYDGSNRYGATFRGDISQGKLVQITTESGGESFFEGNLTPVSISSYLSQLGQILKNQYLLTFAVERSKHPEGDLRDIHVRIEQRDLKVTYPHEVLVPGK